jgi:hypothetical protein
MLRATRAALPPLEQGRAASFGLETGRGAGHDLLCPRIAGAGCRRATAPEWRDLEHVHANINKLLIHA